MGRRREKAEEPVGGADWAGLMPTSASVSFTVKGWLASGVRVEKLALDTARSRGLGAGVQPYKGVKYMTASKGGVETIWNGMVTWTVYEYERKGTSRPG